MSKQFVAGHTKENSLASCVGVCERAFFYCSAVEFKWNGNNGTLSGWRKKVEAFMSEFA